MIRQADIGDWPKVRVLLERLIEQTPYRDIEHDTLSAIKAFGQCVNSAIGFAWVAEQPDGEVTGVLLGVADRLWWSRARYATDLVFYSERAGDGTRLVKKFIKWAWSVPGVVEVTLGQSSGIQVERTGKLYERLGLSQVGGLYSLVKESGDERRSEGHPKGVQKSSQHSEEDLEASADCGSRVLHRRTGT